MSDHLRQYQVAAVDAVFREWETVNSTVLHKATGTGKTVCLAEIVRRAQPKRALILAHRRELVHQAQKKIAKFTDLNAEIEMANERASWSLFNRCHAVVSSVQSQTPGRRSKPTDFDLLVVDECHHVKPGNKSYMDVINHYKQNPNLKILGLTATLEAPCMKVFETVAFSYPIRSAIDEGYLVNIEQQMVFIGGLDYSHVRITAGDLNGKDLAKVVEDEKVCQGMIMGTLETMFSVPHHSLQNLPIEQWADFLFSQGTPRKNLVFTVSVAQAKMMSDIFNRVKPGLSAWVCGESKLVSEEERARIGTAFEKGDLLIVCNCGVFSEGYDNPTIQLVTMARPTKSKTLFTQQIGRGTRILDGVIDGIGSATERLAAIAASAKKSLTILDFVGNCGRHSLVSTTDILAEEEKTEVVERAKKKSLKSDKPHNVIGLLKEAADELAEEKLAREREEAARKARLVGKGAYVSVRVEAFDRPTGKPTFMPARAKDGRQFSVKQADILRKNGHNPERYTYGQGQAIISKLFTKVSAGQARVLVRSGYGAAEINAMSFRQASQAIEAAKANGWRKPGPPSPVAGMVVENFPPQRQPSFTPEPEPDLSYYDTLV